MYQGFWGLAVLTVVLLAHCVYIWKKETEGKRLRAAAKDTKTFRGVLLLGLLIGLCAAGLLCGIVLILCREDSAVVHAAGLVMLLAAFLFNSQLRRFIPRLIKKEEQEELTNE